MRYRLELSDKFFKALLRLTDKEQGAVWRKLELLKDNPSHPSLRCKKIKGIGNLFECSVNMDIRILWRYEDGKIILLLDVGHHSIVDNM